MSCFCLRDETRDRFADLRSEPRVYAEAFTLYGLCGQAAARLMSDGFVSKVDIASECAFMSPLQRKRATAALVRIGVWEAVGEGYQFTHWAGEQMSAEKERSRRDAWKERKARQRERERERRGFPSHSASIPSARIDAHSATQKPQNVNGFRKTTPDVTRDVTAGVTPPPLPLPLPLPPAAPYGSGSPSESPAASAGADPKPKPKPKPKPPKKAGESNVHKRLVAEVYAEAFERAHQCPPGAPNWALVQAIASWAARMPDPEAAIRGSCRGYFGSWVGGRTQHAMHVWAKNPAGFYAEHVERDTGAEATDPQFVVGPDGLSDFDRQFIVRRTA